MVSPVEKLHREFEFFFKLSLIRIIRHHVFIELKILIAFTILDVGILKQGRVD